MRFLALSGSLRRGSTNTALLKAAALLAPSGTEVRVYSDLGNLPHFNPDLDASSLPVVSDFWAQVRTADGLLISSPEYAHGVPGVLKNALDWLVGSDAFYQKPVALLNASPLSTYAQASLVEIITTMAGYVAPEASVELPLRGKPLDADTIASTPDYAHVLRAALAAFRRAIEAQA